MESVTFNNPQTQAPAANFIKHEMQQANPKLDTIFYTKVKYSENGRWHEIETTPKEFIQIMMTGMVDDKNIVAMEIFKVSVNEENNPEDKVRMVYDFVAQHTNKTPWRIL